MHFQGRVSGLNGLECGLPLGKTRGGNGLGRGLGASLGRVENMDTSKNSNHLLIGLNMSAKSERRS